MALRVGIVGCGKIADAHAEEIGKQPGASLVAACDVEPLMAEQLALRFGIPTHYSDFEAMLSQTRPDVVHIATPPQYHVALAEQAIDAGCHVFVEKPLALDLADARRLIEYARAAGRRLTVGWLANFDPAAEQLRALVAGGAIGDPVHIESFYGYDFSGPFGPAFLRDSAHWLHGLPGKLFHNNIDHLLNKLPEHMAAGGPPEVFAMAHPYSGAAQAAEGLYDELRVMIRCGRITAQATFSGSVKPLAHRMTLYGTRNIAQVDHIARTVNLVAAPAFPSALGRLTPPFAQARSSWKSGLRNLRAFARSEFHYFAGLNRLISRFYQSIVEDGPPPIPYEHMLWVYSVMDEIFAQVHGAHSRSMACAH